MNAPQKTFDTFAVSKDSQLVNIYLDEGRQDVYLMDMESVRDNISQLEGADALEEFDKQVDISCEYCVLLKGW